MSQTVPLQAALSRSDSCFVELIRQRMAVGIRPLDPVRLVDDGRPPIAMIEWPDCVSWPALFIALDRSAEVRECH